ncbi:MAG: hypothetical protein GC171_03785 [Terrimonas sp.]|nr:hypothetical protein [Terrimonas sp.]
MKLTKKLEAEVLKAYHTYWDSYLGGDIKTFASLLDDNCHIIGSTAHDTFNNKKDAVAFYKATAKEVAGVGEYRNRNITVLPEGNNVMVQEICDYYFLNKKEWHFYGVARLSTLFSKRSGKWKIIHQHGSLPDSRAEEGQQLGTEKITKENLRLKEAIKRNTIELLNKNRELEIETALEKVRAIAMGMKEPKDMLEVCKTISLQLQSLGVKEIRNIQTAIFYESRGNYMNYEYYAKHRKKIITETSYTNNKMHKAFAAKMLKGKDEFFTSHIKGKKVKDWLAYQKTTNVFIDKYLSTASSLNYYWDSLGPVALGISTYVPLNEEGLNLFKRFRNVFELAYTRYLDIEQALAQAREAQVEASLERVRAQAMAMHQQEDLVNICETFYKEFNVLGFNGLRNAMINIYNDEQKTFVNYDYSDVIGKSINHLTYDIHPEIEKQVKQVRKANDAFSETVFKGTGLESMKKFRKRIGEKDDPRIKNCKALYYYFYSIGAGAIGISTFNPVTEEKLELLKRFRNVFNFSYQRYTDIALAEAQAREAEIELALERVRARTMAMHNSSELAEVAVLLFEQVKHLGVKSFSSGFNIWDSEHKNLISWMSNATGEINPPFELPIKDYEQHKRIFAAWKRKELFLEDDIEGKALTRHYKFLRSFPLLDASFSQAEEAGIKIPDRQVHNIVFFSNGYLLFITQEPTPQYHSIFMRFGKVFDQTYTRFLDLQKAEAQAKEARIETALERVRAVAMAMKKSDEVINVCEVMYKELQSLGFTNIRNAQIALKNDSRQSYSISVYSDNESVLFGEAHYHSSPIVKDLYRELEKSKDAFYQREFSGKKFKDWRKWRQGLSPFADSREASAASMCFYLYSIGIGHIGISTFNAITEIQIEMLKRFKNVFELCYTRYIDVAKAEVQAREAQIELGLERVRARAMAMQHSDELSDLVDTLFTELTKLDFALSWCMINIIDEPASSNTLWMANPDIDQSLKSIQMKFEDWPFHHASLKAYRKRQSKFVYVMEGKEKKDYEQYMFNETEVGKVPAKAKADMKAMKRYVFTYSFSNFGGLQTVGEEPLSEENLDILSRFGKVFDLTYTRFNDLQKAEAQAREAEIQLALERVRARTMAMQKSEELKEVIQLVYEQFIHLNIPIEHTGFLIDYTATDQMHIWVADKHLAPSEITIPWFDSPPNNSIKEAKEKGQGSFSYTLTFEEKNKFYRDLFKFIPGIPVESMDYYFKCPGLAGSGVLLENVGLYIENFSGTPYSDEENNTLMRIGKVFQQTYTRFLDLQKSETQSRENQIQLALERARTQSMVMQHSNELDDTLRVFHEQVLQLGIKSSFSFLWLPDEEKSNHLFWAAWKEGKDDSAIFKSKAITYPLDSNEPATAQCLVDWRSDEPVHSYAVKPAEVNNYFTVWAELLDGVDHLKPEYFHRGLHYVEAFMKYGCFGVMVESELTEEEKKILLRFSIEFEQTYTRFLDLQKAEAQAREAQVEAALEKVRSRSLAMHKSDEMLSVIKVVSAQLQHLNLNFDTVSFGENNQEGDFKFWITSSGQPKPVFMQVPSLNSVVQNRVKDAKQKGISFFTDVLTADENREWSQHLIDNSEFRFFPEKVKAFVLNSPGFARSSFLLKNIDLYLGNYRAIPFTEEENAIFKRFAQVFEQSYTRFLDLQKAEAQAREAQIEAALEKVRSRSLAMHTANELSEVVTVIVEKLTELDVVLDANGVVLCTYFPDSKDVLHWIVSPDFSMAGSYLLPYFDHPIFNDAWNSKIAGDDYFSKAFSVEEKNSFFEYAFEHSDYKNFPEEFKQWIFQNDKHVLSFAWQKNSAILIPSHSGVVPNETEKQILIRFANVFEQAYVRFMDLQKAEAQAREAKIEMALEKIRSRTMAMQHSDELPEAANLLFLEVQALGIPAWSCGYNILAEDKKSSTCIMSSEGRIQSAFHLPFTNSGEPSFAEWLVAIEKEEFFVQELSGKKIEDHYNYMKTLPHVGHVIKELEDAGLSLPSYQINHLSFFNGGFLLFITYEAVPHAHDLFKRFTKVFEQTYTRFLDLQKAEAQAKESEIQLALERVRARTMAMHKSEELAEVAAEMFQQMATLSVTPERLNICLLKEENKKLEVWSTDQDGLKINHHFSAGLDESTTVSKAYKGWKEKKKSLIIDLHGQELNDWVNYVRQVMGMEIKDELLMDHRIHTIAFFSHGMLLTTTPIPLPASSVKLLERFAEVFNLTYRRFLDLQQAEAQAREAQVETRLERVRSRTLAMQHSDELAETAAVLFQQLIQLGIEPNRLYIGITDPHSTEIEFWITDEDGSKVSTMFKGDAAENSSMKKMFEAWKNQERSLIMDMQGKELEDYFHYLGEELHVPFKGGLEQKRRWQYIAYFSKGFIGMAAPDEQPAETLLLLERFAFAFNLTFTRFNDLKIAEAHAMQAELDLVEIKAARKKAEDTLNELQVTQKQLIQSEKMASLGELTAGIAHEIQNPLNFVNNFSEVSNELLDEMMEEAAKGNFEQVKEILNDVKQNLEKINHHGKRADGIVKGMLQHSRSSNGQKELTDINVLADEYLRLAYHGLRAKDKTFNAVMKTAFDETLEKINVIPQDIGRVILNLITNAFYAVNEKKHQLLNEYEPTVMVSTKKKDHSIEISVSDNGNGIPVSIKEKIFQPFFTTKPTGQGTGLGLSLSYDIIKAHGGELKVESTEGEGTEFIIQMPNT